MPERYRILIVDDDASDRQAVVHALRLETAAIDGGEVDVLEVDTVALAREALRNEEFACVFLDHDLPDGTSLDLLMEVRAQGLATPVVVLTGQRDEQTIAEVMRAGAVDYLPKERLHPDLVARSLRAALRFLQVQREKQTVLNELRARDRAIAAASNGISIADPRRPDCPLVYVNEAFLRMTGYGEAEVLGSNCRFLQGPATNTDAVQVLREAIRQERACQVLILNYRKDGTTFWNEVTVSPVRDVQGTLTHFVGVQTDVTERQEADTERRRAEDEAQQFQQLVESANDALFLLDDVGRFQYVNDATCRSLGYTSEQLRRMSAFDIDPLHDASAYKALFQRLDGEKLPPFESLHRRADGTVFPIEASISRLDIGGRPLVFSSARNISERKVAEQALQEARQQSERILESITDAFFTLDREWRFTHVNHETERVLSKSREQLLDHYIWDVFPEGAGSTFDREYRRAVAESVPVSFEEFYPPLDAWLEVRAYPSSDGISVFFQNVSERKTAQDALRASEEALREKEARLLDAQMRLETALTAGGIATWTWDVANDRVVADANLARFFSVSPEDAEGGRIGAYLQAIHPEDRPRVSAAIREALVSRDDYEAEYRVVLPDGSYRWLATRGKIERDAAGQAVSLPGVVLDITERAERGRREQFLAELAERARKLTDPDDVIADAVRSVGEFLSVSRCLFVDIDIQADICTGHPDYRADDTIVSMEGTFPISAFGEAVVAAYAAGRTVTVDDVRADPAQVPEWSIATYEAVGIYAHASVPVVHSDRLVSCMGIHSSTPRHWKPEEVTLLQTVVERTWLTVEVTRQNRALARGAEEQRARAEREALLNRIGQALRGSPDPEEVQASAVDLLGEALGADRCYFALYDLRTGVVRITHDRHRLGLSSIQGTYPFANTVEMFHELYQDSHTSVIADAHTSSLSVQTLANMDALQIRSRISVALADTDGFMATLTASMSDGPRDWTPEEVILVEAVATQLRSGVETARVQRREHRIATDLQNALQPPIPEYIPGLSVVSYTQPALQEASVGGDFYDIFPLDKELYAIVIGDVSGKGLAAAQQLALIRNSLRTTLYLYRAPALAAAGLNAIVTAHDLLVGFVTAWVGVYDVSTGQITYASCGHEPALVRRAATGAVEELGTTGLPIGVAEHAEYGENTITLTPGDALLLYTDGVSESGPSRSELLGTEGLAHFFGTIAGSSDVKTDAARLVASVSQRALGVFRDDVAVLLIRRQ